MIGTGFTFNDGEQILVSVQKPLGLVLEQDPSDTNGAIAVVDIDPNGSAARAGVKVGDVLLAVQNVSVLDKELEDILGFIGGAPRVLNLRLLRDEKAE
jgi:C-terminal processing protease CtpA/Prc